MSRPRSGKRKRTNRPREVQTNAPRSLVDSGHLVEIPPGAPADYHRILRRRARSEPSSPIETASSLPAATPDPIERASSEPPPPPPPSELLLAVREGLQFMQYCLPLEHEFSGDEHVNAVSDIVAGLLSDARLRWWSADALRAEFLLLQLQRHMRLFDDVPTRDVDGGHVRLSDAELLARLRERLPEVDREIRHRHAPPQRAVRSNSTK